MVIRAELAEDPRLADIWAALAEVPDPEIPTLSVLDLGIVRGVTFDADRPGRLRVEIMPTFVGCPAVDAMRAAIAERLREHAEEVEVAVTYAEPWTSERITPEGRRRLAESGFAPPATRLRATSADLLQVLPTFELPVAECPYCGSRRTTLENAFGPTLCRSIYYCGDCRQPFEQFKSV